MKSASGVYKVSKPGNESDHLFGDLLVSKELLSRRELTEALNEQSRKGGRLGEVLLRLKLLTADQVTEALANHLSLEYVRFDDFEKIDMNIARIVPETIAKRFCLVAIGEIDNKVIIALDDPLNVIAVDTIRLKIKRNVKVVISSPREITQAIDVIYHGTDVEEQKLRDLVELEVSTEEEIEDIHNATLNILKETGVKFESKWALKFLKENDCIIDYSDMIVRFPEELIEECIHKTPSSFKWKARDEKNDVMINETTAKI